jgi:hypothetical protein
MTMTMSAQMLPTGQWRVLNILYNAGRGVSPVGFYEPDLAVLVDAEMIELTLGGQVVSRGQVVRLRRRGGGFDLQSLGGEWPEDMRMMLTGHGRSWLRSNVYQRVLMALRGLRARPGRAVALSTAMREAQVGRHNRAVFTHLADCGLICGFWTHTEEQVEPATLAQRLDPALLMVALTRQGQSIVATAGAND